MYTIYTANQWKRNSEWPDGLEPDGYGKPRKIGTAETEAEARAKCTEWNEKNKPGRLVRRASYSSEYKTKSMPRRPRKK
jgi:hypothetical protein